MIIKKSSIFYMIVFIALFKPFMLNYWPLLDNTFNIIKVLLFIFFTTVVLVRKIKGKFVLHRMSVLVILMHTTILVSTIHNHGNYYRWLIEMLGPVSIVLFLELYHKSITNIITTWFRLILFFLSINLLTILTGGIENADWLTDYFLGSKDLFTTVFPFYVFVIYLYGLFNHSYCKNLLVSYCLLNMVLSILLTRSTTMLIQLIVFSFLWLFKDNGRIKKISNYWIFLIVYIVGNVVLLSPQFWSQIWSFFDVAIEKGSGTLVARTRMWIAGLNIFWNNKMLGIGKITEDVFLKNVENMTFHFQLHNQIVEYLATGGLALLLIYSLILIISGININKIKETRFGYISMLICFSLMLASLTSGIYSAEFYFPFVMSAYFDYINSKIKKNNFENSKCTSMAFQH